MKAAIIGAGVIGAGWASRFLANGWDVCVFDPQANAAAVSAIQAGQAALAELHDDLPRAGALSFADDLVHATQDALWVQESIPEQLALKRALLAELTVSSATIIGSSTSGFKPSDLGEGFAQADQLIVCHPFNPVYLLPLVEVVPHAAVDEAVVQRAQQLLEDLRMKPLRVRHEIDGHIADRLLEAVWREALWLIHDGVATTEEIDRAITDGFGLRWAQMGLFESYRLGGGAGGMRHFIEQFGPALKLPWTKLMDVPELDDALIERIVSQSDAQSGQHTTEALSRTRDQRLIAIMKALREVG